jgi:hypothetical protein
VGDYGVYVLLILVYGFVLIVQNIFVLVDDFLCLRRVDSFGE